MNTVGGTSPTTCGLGEVGDLHRHRAVLRRRRARRRGARPPRVAPSRGCARPSAASSSSRTTTGTATLYGRFDTHAHGDGCRRAARAEVDGRCASPRSIDGAPARDPRRRAPSAARARAGASSSSATTSWPASSSASVSEPRPGPDLEHRSPGARSASATTRRAVFGIGEEVLAEAPLRAEPVRVEQRVHRRRGEQSHYDGRFRSGVPAIRPRLRCISMGRGNYKVGAGRPARSHAPLRPVEHVVRAAPRVPPELLVDPHADDDLLLARGEARRWGRSRRRRRPARCRGRCRGRRRSRRDRCRRCPNARPTRTRASSSHFGLA